MLVKPSRLTVERDERGSLVVALLVITVLVSLSATVMTRTLSSMTSTMHDTDYQSAKAQADAALSDALFRIDQFGENDISSFCVAPGNTPYCTLSSIPAAPLARYTARRVDDNTFLVRAQAKVNKGIPFTVQSTVSRQLLFPYAIYAVQSATFHGSTSGISTTDPNFPANIGSGGTITCTGNGTFGAAQFSNSANRCPNPQPLTTPYNPQDPSAAANCPSLNDTNPPPSPPIPCVPAGANTTCPATWGTGTYSGTYYCQSSINLTGTITVGSGGLFIYFIPTSGASLSISSNASINAGGDPTQFALYSAGTNGLVFDGTSPTINGTLWAAHTNVTTNGCKMNIQGAIVLQSVTCNGGPNLTVTYDSRIQTEVQRNWTEANYQVLAATDFSLPSSACPTCY